MKNDIDLSNIIFDWNLYTATSKKVPHQGVKLHDDTLRDGLQSPSVSIPTLEQKVELVQLMSLCGIDSINLGFPGTSKQAQKEVIDLATRVLQDGLDVELVCSGRTVDEDILAIADAAQKTGVPIEAYLFIGSSKIRQIVENWSLDYLQRQTEHAVTLGKRENLKICFVTEDTTRSHPELLKKLYLTAARSGAERVCICDTVGHSTPQGSFQVVRFVRNILDDHHLENILIDFHGHMDRGLGLWNSISAVSAGANQVHGTALGIGERCGNTPIDLLITNLRLLGWIENDLSFLCDYAQKTSKYLNFPISHNYSVSGKDAFSTSSGVHASAIRKASKRNNTQLLDSVYSGVPASWFGKTPSIQIGPMSGKSNVLSWFEKNQIDFSEDLTTLILDIAKNGCKTMSDEELFIIIENHGNRPKE